MFLNGTIAEESWFDDDVTPQLFRDELNAGSGDITVWINSPGGDCIAAAQIYNMLMEYKGNVIVKIDGIAASAASVIAMAGTKVCVSPVSMLMIHNPSAGIYGNTAVMQKAIEMLDEVKESIVNAYEIKTGMSRAKISHLMDAETWMDANSAVEMGFADEILQRSVTDEIEIPQVNMVYSQVAVTNSLMSKIAKKCRIEPKAEETKTKADSLMDRLNLMKIGGNYTMTIQELREARNKAWEGAKAFVESKRDKDGLLSEEDAKTYAEMEKKVKDYSLEIERMEQMDALENEMRKPINTPIVTKPATDKPKDVRTGRASDEYKEGMLKALRSNFKQITNILQEGVDADGGYLVPEEYDNRLIDVLDEENIMRKLGHKITTSGEHKINIAATKPAAAWIEEGGALQFGEATFDQILLDAHKLHVAIKVTEELLYDNAFGLENYIITQFGKALANAEEDAFLNGSGVGQPLGLFADKGGGTVAGSTTTLKAEDIISLVYSLKRPYRKMHLS